MPDWLYGVLIGSGIVGLASMIWKLHEKRIDERFDALWDQVGRSSEEGMRRSVHASVNFVQNHEGDIAELKRRADRLESKVFNGHK